MAPELTIPLDVFHDIVVGQAERTGDLELVHHHQQRLFDWVAGLREGAIPWDYYGLQTVRGLDPSKDGTQTGLWMSSNGAKELMEVVLATVTRFNYNFPYSSFWQAFKLSSSISNFSQGETTLLGTIGLSGVCTCPAPNFESVDDTVVRFRQVAVARVATTPDLLAAELDTPTIVPYG